jgi:hypothetical protein
MKAVTPMLEAPQLRVAEDQPQYTPVTVALMHNPDFIARQRRDGTRYNAVVMAFRPSDEERAQLAAGADIYVSLLTFGEPQQPIIVTAGKEAMADVYGVAVARDAGLSGPPGETSPGEDSQ